MRILIVGATGGSGRELVKQGLERGHEVTAFARRPEAVAIRHERLRVARGDVLDAASVAAAMAGQEAVLSALGHKRWLYPTRILSQGTANVLDAMAKQGVRRFVCETSLGVGDGWWRLGLYYTLFVIPVILPFYFWDKHRQEKLVRRSGAEWILVRPGVLTNGRRRGTYRHGPRIGNPLWPVRISRADVADFMLNQLTDDAYLRSAPGVAW